MKSIEMAKLCHTIFSAISYVLCYMECFLVCQIGDLKGVFGLFMVQMQILRAKLKVLDMSYGNGTGNVLVTVFIFVLISIIIIVKFDNYDLYGY